MNKRFITLLLLAVFILAGCGKESNTNNNDLGPNPSEAGEDKPQTLEDQIKNQSKIKKFASLDELKLFLDDIGSPSSHDYGAEIMWNSDESSGMTRMESVTGLGDATGLQMKDSAPAESESSGSDYSQTNIQVEGVDEADLVKSDGENLFLLSGKELFIVKAYPAEEAKVLSSIQFKSNPQNIYINGDRLAVFGYNSEFWRNDSYSEFRRKSTYTFFKIFDISDLEDPKQVRDLDFEGSYADSRMIGDTVYFVTANHGYYNYIDDPILPRILESGQEIGLNCPDGRCAYDIYYFDLPYERYNFTSVNSIDLKDTEKDVERDIYVFSGGQNMYVSQNNIYITYTKHIPEFQLETEVMRRVVYPELSQENRDRIAKIE